MCAVSLQRYSTCCCCCCCCFSGDADALATYADATEWLPKWLPEWSICGRWERGPLLAASAATVALLATATGARLVYAQPGHRAQNGETCSRLQYITVVLHRMVSLVSSTFSAGPQIWQKQDPSWSPRHASIKKDWFVIRSSNWPDFPCATKTSTLALRH